MDAVNEVQIIHILFCFDLFQMNYSTFSAWGLRIKSSGHFTPYSSLALIENMNEQV